MLENGGLGQRSGMRPVSGSAVSQKKLKVRFCTSSSSGSSVLTGTTGRARTVTGSSFSGGVLQPPTSSVAADADSPASVVRRVYLPRAHAATGAWQQRAMNCSCSGMAATQAEITPRTLSPSCTSSCSGTTSTSG